ncbi:MAG: hypothetical protein U9R51_03320, partial [Actinomycetota bacterium]|nr:hypothetical protein [Actinomycetota bacterium]
MNRRIGVALGVALLSGLASAAILVVLLSAPSAALPARGFDQAAASTAVHDAALTVFRSAEPGTPPPVSADGIGAFDPETATWHLRTRGGDPTVFVFGTAGSIPLVGDWDGDGIETIGTYEPSTATVALRNANNAGPADIIYSLGVPGDSPIAGDFDGDGLDSVSVYRPTDGFVRIYNRIGEGIADPIATYAPAGAGGSWAAGDFNGDGIDTIASHAPKTGAVTIGTSAGAMTSEFIFDSEGDRYFTGDWTGDGVDTPGLFDSTTATVHLRHTNTAGGPDESYPWGALSWVPVSGKFGALSSPVTVSIDGAPQGLTWAVESLYLELDAAPYVGATNEAEPTAMSATTDLGIEGTAVTAEAYGGQVAVITTGDDTILAVSDDGWTWRPVGGTLESQGLSLLSETDPRFVVLIGSDA